jgi:hypothetical protein
MGDDHPVGEDAYRANLDRERALASTRLVIESVFSNLKEQMRLARHLAPHPGRTRRPHRPTHPRAHPRNSAQHPDRPTRTRLAAYDGS